ncbi:hypothetical protein AN391_01938 [Pseudoalteromonas sp. P1-13-1a]|nr:hypothetical protein AN391_01938 [Pseudoalteromonas sp. P1-13-1a]KPZ60987.1 hypothetical protein AN389_02221 [Pseudoalteromonas sp. P1-7a]
MRFKAIRIFSMSLLVSLFLAPVSYAKKAEPINLSIDFTLPKINTEPYHRPYVAIWLETPDREGIHTLVFWHEQQEWFKDLRQWWRKIGRKASANYDGVSGATRKPNSYQVSWQGQLSDTEMLPQGEYTLNFEAVREEGSREYLKQKIRWDNNQPQHYQLQGQTELGAITITIE